MNLEELKRISKGLELINDVTPDYTKGRIKGFTDDDTDKVTRNALWDAEDVINTLITDLEEK